MSAQDQGIMDYVKSVEAAQVEFGNPIVASPAGHPRGQAAPF